jgi:translocation and assembly module TamA
MRVYHHLQLWTFCLVLFSTALCADQVEYVVTGVDEPMLTNVRSYVSAYRIGSSAKLNNRLRRKLLEDAKNATANALRPFGYFNPVVSTEIHLQEAGKWILNVAVAPGPPVLVQKLDLELAGPGRELKSLKDWKAGFPLTEGKVLNQQEWDKAKLSVIDLLEKTGYFQAQFSRHAMRVDPQTNSARLELVLDTGPRFVIGKVVFNQEILNPGVLASLQRFREGDPYNSWLLGRFRLDLWRSGYFEDIEIVERHNPLTNPPSVDLEVNFVARKRDTYQGTIGYGTDTQVRFQFLWGRHLVSSRGDNLDVGFGWQQRDNQFTFQTNYRLPRKTRSQQFWIASLGLKSENQALTVSENGNLEPRFDIASGKVNDLSMRFGKSRARNMRGGLDQLFETVFAQYLNENRNFSMTRIVDTEPQNLPALNTFEDLLRTTSNTLAIGVDWDWPEIRGSGFRTTGHHERAWAFTSNKAWGSDVNFSQVYLSGRWNFLAGNRWKFLLRAEAGYSDATTNRVQVPTEGGELTFQSSNLPYLYRFKAGGSNSVRGYAYQLLDNNGLGSNNIFTASAEAEFHFREKWSVAAFMDIGNAFNDWSKPELKLGTGFGLRWYSVIGALRLDLAQGWDLEGDPWRIHLTIGTPLL